MFQESSYWVIQECKFDELLLFRFFEKLFLLSLVANCILSEFIKLDSFLPNEIQFNSDQSHVIVWTPLIYNGVKIFEKL